MAAVEWSMYWARRLGVMVGQRGAEGSRQWPVPVSVFSAHTATRDNAHSPKPHTAFHKGPRTRGLGWGYPEPDSEIFSGTIPNRSGAVAFLGPACGESEPCEDKSHCVEGASFLLPPVGGPTLRVGPLEGFAVQRAPERSKKGPEGRRVLTAQPPNTIAILLY